VGWGVLAKCKPGSRHYEGTEIRSGDSRYNKRGSPLTEEGEKGPEENLGARHSARRRGKIREKDREG